MDHDIELVADKAAGDPVPAEAIEAVARWLAAQAGWTNPGPWQDFKHRKFYEQRADEVLAAAAPLIAADLRRQLAETRDALDDEKWLSGQAETHLRELRTDIERLTAERDAARRDVLRLLEMTPWAGADISWVEGDTPGGSR